MAADIGQNTIGAHMRPLRIISLNDNMAMVSALANDNGYSNVFIEQLKDVRQPDDLLIVTSGSGNSPNVLNAIRCARSHSAEVAGLLGFDGGQAAKLVDLPIIVPSDDYGVVEDVHLMINHIMVDHFKRRLAEDRPWVV